MYVIVTCLQWHTYTCTISRSLPLTTGKICRTEDGVGDDSAGGVRPSPSQSSLGNPTGCCDSSAIAYNTTPAEQDNKVTEGGIWL